MAAFVLEHGIDADDKVAPPIIASQEVPADNLIGQGKKATVGTVCALDPWLLTDAPHPFICTSWLVACPPGLSAFKTNRINIFSPAKQGPEQRNLVGSR
jgi:hypothetical protein